VAGSSVLKFIHLSGVFKQFLCGCFDLNAF
jgi:hypothetical protein